MKRLSIAILFVMAAAFAPAPIMDQRSGVRPQAEHTQEQIASQQQHQMTMGELGSSPADTEPNVSFQGSSDGKAADTLRAGSSTQSGREDEQAQAAIKEASKGKGDKSSGSFLWIAVIAAVLGFGVVAGLRAWANKAIPMPSERTRYRL